ncbi:hypothetical protein B5D77_03205 [Microcystis sp. MC19]|nr:hypothetical protein B5D77_03205 [Microcystis sp. MC19]
MMASLGGFLARKGDGEPGVKTIWLGLRRLHDISQTWGLSHPRVKIVVRSKNSPITVALSPACLPIPTIPPMFLAIAFLAVIPWRFFRKHPD